MKPLLVRKTWDVFAKRFPRLACEIDYRRRNKYFERDLWLTPWFCSPNLGTIDVGANTGRYSRWLAKYSRQVDSFECNPMLLTRLEKFLPANVRLHKCALSSEEGVAEFRYDPGNTGVGTVEPCNRLDRNPGIERLLRIEVPVRKLDSLELERISLVKIDVEGHELEVLRGARDLIQRDRPALLIEIEERHCEGNLERVPQWLDPFGYEAKCLTPAKLELGTVECLRDAADRGVNNFWFLPL